MMTVFRVARVQALRGKRRFSCLAGQAFEGQLPHPEAHLPVPRRSARVALMK